LRTESISNEAKDTSEPEKQREETCKLVEKLEVPWGLFLFRKNVITKLFVSLVSEVISKTLNG
jgi:hypothetical protein